MKEISESEDGRESGLKMERCVCRGEGGVWGVDLTGIATGVACGKCIGNAVWSFKPMRG